MHEQAVINAQLNTEILRQRPHVLMQPRVFPDGNKWCALYGDDLMSGVAGFGDTPEGACYDFDMAWGQNRLPVAKG
jgi:hypothetical protein